MKIIYTINEAGFIIADVYENGEKVGWVYKEQGTNKPGGLALSVSPRTPKEARRLAYILKKMADLVDQLNTCPNIL